MPRALHSSIAARFYVVYCDGIGCNASTKGAYKLARLGFRAKELLGGIDWWRRDGHPVTVSCDPGRLLAAEYRPVGAHRQRGAGRNDYNLASDAGCYKARAY